METARIYAGVVIALMTLATASPVVPALRGHKGDSFPLSWYPMFANERPRYETPTYIVGYTAAGERKKVDVTHWTRGGFNQGRNMLTTAVKKRQTATFCDQVAVSVSRRTSTKDVQRLEIVKGTYDREKYFLGDTAPLHEKVLGGCAVKR